MRETVKVIPERYKEGRIRGSSGNTNFCFFLGIVVELKALTCETTALPL